MLDEVPAKELEALEVLAEEYCGILLCCLKLVVLLQIQLTLDPKVGIQSLDFLLRCGSLVH